MEIDSQLSKGKHTKRYNFFTISTSISLLNNFIFQALVKGGEYEYAKL